MRCKMNVHIAPQNTKLLLNAPLDNNALISTLPPFTPGWITILANHQISRITEIGMIGITAPYKRENKGRRVL